AQTGWVDLREAVMLAKGPTYHICGTKLHGSEVEIDHITPRKRFQDSPEADRMKHLQPVWTSCHRAKTKTDRKVQSRMPCKCAPCHAQMELPPEVAGVQGS